jgi:hypothetical protein
VGDRPVEELVEGDPATAHEQGALRLDSRV